MVSGLVAVGCQHCGVPLTPVRDCKSRRAGLCSRCFKRLYDKVYREQHKDLYKEYAQRYYQANRDKLREKNTVQKRAWRAANRQHYREYQRDYKRKVRSNVGYAWEDLPKACSVCGEDLSTRWATRSRRQGLCPRCYRRRAQAEYHEKVKSQRRRRPRSSVRTKELQCLAAG